MTAVTPAPNNTAFRRLLVRFSSTFSSLITTIAELQKKGCTLDGLTEINSRYDDWKTGKKERIPAFKMSIAK